MSLTKPRKASAEPKRKLWSNESMTLAVKAVREGMGLREGARLYNVPHETLRRRVIGAVEMGCMPGPPTTLTEEEKLVWYVVDMTDMGFGLTHDDPRFMAFRTADVSGRPHPFQNGMAGRAWLEGFRACHPRLTLRTAQSLSYSRAVCANEETTCDYFAKLGAIYARLNILTKPVQIFNMDESGISIVHKPGKVITEIGRKNLWSVTSAEKGKTHTVLACVSASGYTLPPFVIYPRKRMKETLKDGAPPGTVFQCSGNGWITQELYLEWFKFFLASIPPARPVLLIEDGHTSHISIEVIQLARSNDIHLLCLPSHTTHILQPLDMSVFKSLKSHYWKECQTYMAASAGRVITTEVVASLLGKAWPLAFTPVNIMSGFTKSGTYPLNPGEVSDRQLTPSKAFNAPYKSQPASGTSPTSSG